MNGSKRENQKKKKKKKGLHSIRQNKKVTIALRTHTQAHTFNSIQFKVQKFMLIREDGCIQAARTCIYNRRRGSFLFRFVSLFCFFVHIYIYG